ncbi:phage tail terminator family protein [Anaerosalibacter sp. Marseille-P3206]|uniref:phage tail terminator family protein n=1 Tax=Anaerosalibacter sp. Marseille-P3206 TaxID=1871005 RepID=UPI000985F9A9|nr:hypothetical protein [Anaerosalibacter sp. Marseille-P3206]
MVKYTEIHKAIVNKLNKTGINTTSKDVSEGFDRPSFFISLDNIKASDFMREALDREITVRIYYFSTTVDNNRIELLNMQDKLNEIFLEDNLIRANEYVNIEIDELEFNIIDKVLHCYFDIRLCENYDRVDDTPTMEELQIERKG